MNNEEKIISYLFGDMNEAQKKAFEQEIQSSDTLSKELEDYGNVFEVIEDIESAVLPESSQARFDKMLETEIAAQKQLNNKVVPMRTNYWKMIGIAASFALLGLFIGYQMQSNNQNERLAGKITEDQKNEFTNLVRQERTSQKIGGLELLEDVAALDDDVLKILEEILYNDPSTNVRLAVVDALRGHTHQENVKEVLIKGLENIDKPVIKISLIQAISGTASKQLLPALERALQQEGIDKSVEEELYMGIMKLSKNS